MAIDLADKTSNGNTLTNVGATEVTTALPFAASTIAVDLELTEVDYLHAADSASLSITGNLTIEMWVKLESIPSNGGDYFTFFSKYKSAGNQRSYIYGIGQSAAVVKLWFATSDNGAAGANYAEVFVNWTPTVATWYHIAVVYTAAGGTADFYVDGVQQGTQQSGLKTSLFDSTAPGIIGAFDIDATPLYLFDGVIDEVRIWNIARTATQIANNRSIELTGSESGLAAYWPFESSIGSSFTAKISLNINQAIHRSNFY